MGGGTCFYKASMSTHRSTNVFSRLLIHVLRVETAPLVEVGRKVNRRGWLQITGGGTCFYKASMSTHRGTNLISRLLLHVLEVETAPMVEAGRKENRRCWLQITGGGTSFYKASISTQEEQVSTRQAYPWYKFNLQAPSQRTRSRNCTHG